MSRSSTQPAKARGTKLPLLAAVAALFALLVLAPFASAASDPIGSSGSSSVVTFNNGFLKKLKKNDVKVLNISPAKKKGKRVTMTVTGGSLDPLTGLGSLTLGGGIKFKAGKKTAQVKALSLDTSNKSLSGKVANKKMKVASLAGVSFAREGFGTVVTVNKLKLTKSAANQLNKKLGEKVFKANQVMGSSSSNAQPTEVAVLPTNNATLALSASALKKLAHVGTPPFPEGFSPVAVELSIIAPTTIVNAGPPPTLGFPIGGGTISPTASSGTIQTTGGLKLVQNLEKVTAEPGNVTTLTMSNIWVDLATKTASVEVTIENPKNKEANLGNLGRSSIADISLTGATITSNPATRTVSVQNAAATLQAVTAATLNAVFIEGLEKANPAFAGQEKFAAGDPLGTFSFLAQTQ
jgi:Htaa